MTILLAACRPANLPVEERNPLEAPPVDSVRVSLRDVDEWKYRREFLADLDGDGQPERLVMTADVEVRPDGVLLWEDGHRWAFFAENAAGDRTLLYAAFVPNGFAVVAVLQPDDQGRRKVLVQERTPQQLRSLEIEYRGPGARDPAPRPITRWRAECPAARPFAETPCATDLRCSGLPGLDTPFTLLYVHPAGGLPPSSTSLTFHHRGRIMPMNANILLIRHAEKPDDDTDTGLAPLGQARAQAYVAFFQNYAINQNPVRLKYVFATADSHESHRPRLTVTPLAQALGLSIDDKHADKDYEKVAEDLLNHPKYNGSDVLVCWHHGKILDLAAALGASAVTLPPSANWPARWPGEVFGWVLQLCYDADGKLIPAQTLCLSEQLMYDDYGQEPATGSSAA